MSGSTGCGVCVIGPDGPLPVDGAGCVTLPTLVDGEGNPLQTDDAGNIVVAPLAACCGATLEALLAGGYRLGPLRENQEPTPWDTEDPCLDQCLGSLLAAGLALFPPGVDPYDLSVSVFADNGDGTGQITDPATAVTCAIPLQRLIRCDGDPYAKGEDVVIPGCGVADKLEASTATYVVQTEGAPAATIVEILPVVLQDITNDTNCPWRLMIVDGIHSTMQQDDTIQLQHFNQITVDGGATFTASAHQQSGSHWGANSSHIHDSTGPLTTCIDVAPGETVTIGVKQGIYWDGQTLGPATRVSGPRAYLSWTATPTC